MLTEQEQGLDVYKIFSVVRGTHHSLYRITAWDKVYSIAEENGHPNMLVFRTEHDAWEEIHKGMFHSPYYQLWQVRAFGGVREPIALLNTVSNVYTDAFWEAESNPNIFWQWREQHKLLGVRFDVPEPGTLVCQRLRLIRCIN